MKTKHLVSLSAAALLLLAGCATQPAGPAPQESTKFTVENTEKFVLLDKASQAAITCTGLQERTLPDGRIEVVANLKNRESHPFQLQVNCVFKDEQGFSTGDETVFQTVTIGRRDTEAVRFTAANDKARKYTLRVREAK